MEGLFWIVAIIGIYFLPGIVAHIRDHNNENPIVLLNLFLGWTFLGWIVALVWAASDNTAAAPATEKPAKPIAINTNDEERIPCPHCAELILPQANICKHRGREISAAT